MDRKEAKNQAWTGGEHWFHPLEILDWRQRFLALLDDGDQAHLRARAPPGHQGRSNHVLRAICSIVCASTSKLVWLFDKTLLPFHKEALLRQS